MTDPKDATAQPQPPTDGPTQAPDATIAPQPEGLNPQASGDMAATIEVALLRETVATLEHQIKDLTDRLLRSHADLDNLRKRADRDKADTAKYAISKFAADVVDVGDSFQHAISAVTPEAAEKDPALKSFLDGVTLAERAFLGVLERHGITRINPVGEPFNPHLHHAAAEEQDASVASGTIVKVYQVGFLIEERVLRPAMVVVARGGEKPAPVELADPSAPETPKAPSETAS